MSGRGVRGIKVGVIVGASLLCGCATVHTISHNKRGVEIDGTYCKKIQHVMSGTSHNICMMYGKPKDTDGIHTRNNLVWLYADSVFSLVADVIVLPYTIYKQITAPPIRVNPEKTL